MSESANKLILVVDDVIDNQFLLTTLLEAKGHRVLCVSNGEEALNLLRELAYLPDLILLDAQMPVMDGYLFREAQCKSDRLRAIPVVVMTAECSLDTNTRMNHPQAIMIKPLRLTSIFECISPYL